MTPKTVQDSREGHRARLRARFLQSGLDGFLDYEIVELLLTLGTPRKDCKQPAKQAIEKFKGLQGVLDASLEDLQEIKGIGPANAFGIKLFQAVAEQYAKVSLSAKLSLHDPEAVYNFLKEKIGREKTEQFVLLFFDTRNNLITHTISSGTLNASLVHPREVFSQAIAHHASHVIIAHNHPSGDSTPSQEDITTTKQLVEAGKILGIAVVDHLIICRNSFVSLREKGTV